MNENAQDYLQRAITLMGRENYPEAKKLVELALAEDPRYAEAYSVLGDIYVNTDDLDNALESYRKVALLEPDNADNLFDMGSVYILKDDLANGIKCYNNAETKGYSGYRLYLNLARIYEGIGHKEQALRNYNKAVSADTLNTDLRLARAAFDVKEGRYHEALEDLDELQQLEPDLFDGYSLRAEIYCSLGKYEEALQVVETAMEKFPEDAALKALKAKVLLQTGRSAEARQLLEDVEKSDQFERVRRSSRLMMAEICSMENNLQGAAEQLEKLLEEEDPDDPEANFLLMNIRYGMKDYTKTLELAEKLAGRETVDVYSVTGRYFVPFIQKKTGNTEEAQRGFRELTSDLRKVTVRFPHMYEAYLYRLLSHKELGEYDKALELADYIEDLDEHSADAFIMRYAIYKDMGDEENAAKMKEVVRKMRPDVQL